MPGFKSFKNMNQEAVKAEEAEQAKAEMPAPAAAESKEKEKNVFREVAELSEKSADRRPGWPSDYAQRQEELVAAGAMSKLESQKLDEELKGGRGSLLGKLSFRNMFGFLMKGGEEWKLAASAENKIWKAKDIAYLVEEGNMSREDYLELLKLEGQDANAAEAKKQELFKGKCDELSALVESPVFKEFQDSLDMESKRLYEMSYQSAFNSYREGRYGEAMKELQGFLDSDSPWVSYGKCPINKMVKMQKMGLIGDKEMKRVFGRVERNQLNVAGDREFGAKMGNFIQLERLRGAGKVDNEQFKDYIERTKEEPIPA